MGKFVSRKGHNARITGLAMIVFGLAFGFAFAGVATPQSLCFVVAFAGFITFVIGIGLGRETPPSEQATSRASRAE